MSDQSSYVAVRGLSKLYGGRKIVTNVEFEVQTGEFISLLGPSGSGKTTVLRMLAGLIRPDGGSIHIGDQEVFSDGREVSVERRGIGMVFQDFALWPHMTVEQNIAFGLRLRRVSRRERRARVVEMLELVDLKGFERRYPNQLSGGQQQRVALARALSTHPQLLLLDEPLSSLDTGLRETMREELVRIVRKAEMTVINVTHDQDEALVMSDRIILLDHGMVQQVGTPAELYWQPATAFVGRFMGPANVISGQVVGLSTDEVNVRWERVKFAGRARPQVHCDLGEEHSLLFRPEDVTVSETPGDLAESHNRFDGVVTSAFFSGGRWRLRVDVSGVEVLAVSDRRFMTGARVWMSVGRERCVLVQPQEPAMSEASDASYRQVSEAAAPELAPKFGAS